MNNVLNLGAGVQSSCILLMSCKGLLPQLDCAIFADTGWEPKAVYDHLGWLEENYPDRAVPRSACIGCPYHSNEEWRQMKKRTPEEFDDAISFDIAIRKSGGMRGDVYIHRSCKPLDTIDFRSDIEKGQGHLWEDECDGMCGV